MQVDDNMQEDSAYLVNIADAIRMDISEISILLKANNVYFYVLHFLHFFYS